MRKYDRIYDPVANAAAIDEKNERAEKRSRLRKALDAAASLAKKTDR